METEALIVKYIDILSQSMRKSTRKYKEECDCDALFRLTITQLHYLHAIKNADGTTFKQLTEKFNVQKSTVTDSVNRLISRDLVCKKQSAEDLRVFYVHLTEKGEELLDVESKGYYHFAQKMTKCLNDAEKEQFTQLLKKITETIKE